MACKCAPALNVLKEQLDKRWPARDRASDGCCGDAAHSTRKSDHNPDGAGFAHARDIDRDLGDGTSPHTLAEVLLNDHRAKYVIFDGHIGFLQHRGLPVAQWPVYTGPNAHRHHIHVSIQPTATHDTNWWALPGTPVDEEDDLTKEQADQLQQVRDSVARQEQQQGRIEQLLERIVNKLGA